MIEGTEGNDEWGEERGEMRAKEERERVGV